MTVAGHAISVIEGAPGGTAARHDRAGRVEAGKECGSRPAGLSPRRARRPRTRGRGPRARKAERGAPGGAAAVRPHP